MEQAIKIAIENGYEHVGIDVSQDGQPIVFTDESNILLDPLFWQALGKGLGWEEFTTTWVGNKQEDVETLLTWIFNWHRFIDHLAEGKDIDSFFSSRLPTN